jgi:hypothetical protein
MSETKFLDMILATARAAFGFPAAVATAWYDIVFPAGMFLTIFFTVAEKSRTFRFFYSRSGLLGVFCRRLRGRGSIRNVRLLSVGLFVLDKL